MTDFVQRLFDPKAVAFADDTVGRVFLACMTCGKVKPHYHLYAERGEKGYPLCSCGGNTFRPRHISELKAAFLVLVVGWFWRKTVLRERRWDPRMPVRADGEA